ncbi:AAA family ATPase [Pseudomonas petrae]|uniref:AAA family ATPase n=1 Tax=Pseudomonas petrae TaxID=2912190 RepID=UPI001EFFD07D|nr:AAA family ATPase [Pseudomonas petrae]MCF7539815.1 AAA family ATPase [Pseudomonas petrae]
MASSNGTQSGTEKNPITAFFGTRKSSMMSQPLNSVLITASKDDWNDFGFRTRIDVSIQLSDGVDFSTAGFIGFIPSAKDEANGVDRLKILLEDTDGIERVTDQHRFFTMLPSMEAYRMVVRTLGLIRSRQVLKAMRDVVVLSEFKSTANWLGTALRTDIFLKSFIRNADSYFAYKNAGSILRGLAHEQFGRISGVFAIDFLLPGRQNSHELIFKFDHDADLPKRIAVIIGKNGVGKSQTLGRIVRAALDGNNALNDGSPNSRVLVNRILAFAPTNEAGSVFPTDRRKRPRVWYRRFTLNRSGSKRKDGGVADQVVQVARSQEYIGELSRWKIFLHSLIAIDNWEQICLPVREAGHEPISLRRLRHGGEQHIIDKLASIDLRREPVRLIADTTYPLSSGEISFVRFAAQASLFVENGSLLLLDEPETHLHPNFISQFVSLLDNLLKLTGSAAIIATHSAYFVREVFQDQVSVLRTDEDGFVRVERPALRTFGADVGAISYFVFGEDEPSQLAAAVEERLLERFSSWNELYRRYKDELSLELLGKLREAMERGQ